MSRTKKFSAATKTMVAAVSGSTSDAENYWAPTVMRVKAAMPLLHHRGYAVVGPPERGQIWQTR
jgi:hypothetical protein